MAVALPRVAAAVAAHGLTEPMAMEAVENSARMRTILPGVASTLPPAASQPPAAAAVQGAGPGPIALLSLFDGTDIARLCLHDYLRMAGPHRLCYRGRLGIVCPQSVLFYAVL